MPTLKKIGAVAIVLGMSLGLAGIASAQTTTVSGTVASPGALGDSPAMNIKADGSDTGDGAQVTNISGNVITATITWGQVNETWIIDTSSSTTFRRRYGALSSLSEISVGDTISFMGTFVSNQGNNLVTNASFVKDWSIQHRDANFSGIVTSISTGNQSFDMQTSQGFALDVFTSPSTIFMENGATTTYGSIQPGVPIKGTHGVWDSDNNTFQADWINIGS